MSVTSNKFLFFIGLKGSGKHNLADRLFRDQGFIPIHYEN